MPKREQTLQELFEEILREYEKFVDSSEPLVQKAKEALEREHDERD